MKNWEFNPHECRLRSEGDCVALTKKAAAVLEYLVSRRGEVVARDDILAHVWRDISVTPDLVREYIFDIRHALGDDAKSPRYIETIRGKGVRFLGGVSIGSAGMPAEPVQLPRVSVEPPEIFGGEGCWRDLARPLQQEIRLELARYSDLTVLGRTRQPSEPDVTIQADFRVVTAITLGDEHVSVLVQVVKGADERIVCTDRFNRPLSDLPTVTAEIATRISAEIGRFRGIVHDAVLTSVERKPAGSFSAYEEYLMSVKCEHEVTLEDWRQGLEHADRAIALDPTFARGWHMRATILRGLVNFFFDPDLDPDTAFREAEFARRKSLALNPRDPHILAWSADLYWEHPNPSVVQDTLLRAADLGSRQPDTLSYCSIAFILHLARFEEAVALIDEALRLSPTPPEWYRMVECRAAYFTGDFTRSIVAAKAAPTTLPSLLFSAMSLFVLEHFDAARSAYAELLRRFPKFSPTSYATNMMPNPETARHFLSGIEPLTVEAAPHELLEKSALNNAARNNGISLPK
ncbi:winged helix-turn-helix domain-containing protein [Roseobacter sp.]|uniref:winged helix-turn-helix domain-containing protein n=1 Tax=Roseobacter sp. TaxID=1907202 RepID=UPI00385B2057